MSKDEKIGLSDGVEILQTLERRHFYDVIELKREAGHIVLVRKSENFKTRAGVDCRLG